MDRDTLNRIVAALALIPLSWCAGTATAQQEEAAEAPPTPTAVADQEADDEADAASRSGPDQRFRFEPYGRLKADVSLDSSTVDPGNFARWVQSPDVAPEHSQFNLTVRESRLGAHIHAPVGGPQISGHFEVDFYGGGTENRNILQLRHAHIDVDWGTGWSLLAGQFSDVISPLVPTTVNYSVAWWVGNIGYRRPQVRGTRMLPAGGGEFVVTLAVSRTIGDAFAQGAGDTGAESGRPTVQGRLAYEWRSHGRNGGVGVSGHQGSEIRIDETGEQEVESDSWSVGIDLSVPVGRYWHIKGEAWTGKNLDDYLGGIGQGVEPQLAASVRATGGWAAVEFRPSTRWLLSAGAGVDDPDEADLPAEARSHNRAIWGNAIFDFGRGLSAGLEVSHWRTEYVGLGTGAATRGQAALIFAF